MPPTPKQRLDPQRHFGVYRATVTNAVDPRRRGRIQVEVPSLGRRPRVWATFVSPYADEGAGLQLLPRAGSEVVVAFEAGDLRRPYVVGAIWGEAGALPEPGRAAADKRLLRTRAGHKLAFDDRAGAAKVELSTAGGHRVELDDAGQKVTVEHAAGSRIVIDAAGRIEIHANTTIELSAAKVDVHAPVVAFDGVVSCATLIASAGVVSPSYTPGAGNIW